MGRGASSPVSKSRGEYGFEESGGGAGSWPPGTRGGLGYAGEKPGRAVGMPGRTVGMPDWTPAWRGCAGTGSGTMPAAGRTIGRSP